MMDKPVGHIYQPLDGALSTPPSQRLHLILLGVDNVAKSIIFYEALGWVQSPTSFPEFPKFDLGGYALCLLPKENLAKNVQADVSTMSGFSGVVFVYLAKKPEDVPNILYRAIEAGGTLVRPATRTEWGIAGYFQDPDGHIFEVDYEYEWMLDDDHHLIVDKMNT